MLLISSSNQLRVEAIWTAIRNSVDDVSRQGRADSKQLIPDMSFFVGFLHTEIFTCSVEQHRLCQGWTGRDMSRQLFSP